MNNKMRTTPNIARTGSGSYVLVAGMIFLASLMTGGCAGIQTFPSIAMAGDTVALAIDRQASVSKQDVVIRIVDSTLFTQDIPGTDPSVRGWINVYPDPVSKLVVGKETGQGLSVGALGWGNAAQFESNGTKDWFDTIMYLDLPGNLQPGLATIDVLVANVSILPQPVELNIVLGAGSPNTFDTWEYGPLQPNQFGIMERADHYKVTFSGGSVVPTAIQVDIAHDPDRESINGVGQVYVTQPRADLNAINWTDDGSSLRVIITPAWIKSPEDIAAIIGNERLLNWFDFYIAGGITGLQAPLVSAYDEDGIPVTGVMATIQ